MRVLPTITVTVAVALEVLTDIEVSGVAGVRLLPVAMFMSMVVAGLVISAAHQAIPPPRAAGSSATSALPRWWAGTSAPACSALNTASSTSWRTWELSNR